MAQAADRRRRRAGRRRLAADRVERAQLARASCATETRERVQRAIAELAYRPHAAARRLRTRRSSTIGIHLDPYSGGISGVILDRFVHALTERASERGMRVLIYSARSAEEEIERLGDLVDGAEIDAVVVTGTFFGDPRTGWLLERDVPFVSFGRPVGRRRRLPLRAHVGRRRRCRRHARRHAARPRDGGPARRLLRLAAGQRNGRRPRARLARGDGGCRCDRSALRGGRRTGARPRRDDGRVRRPGVLARPRRARVRERRARRRCASGRGGRRDGASLPVIGFDNTPVAEALGISSIEQSPELVAAAVLDLLMGPTGPRRRAARSRARAGARARRAAAHRPR